MRRLSLVATLSLLAMLVFSPAAVAQKDLNCADFGSQAEAQQNLRANPSDPNGLDAENDGVACETFDYPEGTPRDETPVTGAQQPGGDLDCPDFASQAEAQAVYNQDPTDPNGLDADNDGEACEEFFDDANGNGTGMNNQGEGNVTGNQYADDATGAQYADDGADNNVVALPDTGGPALLPLVALIMALGGLGLSVLRRSR